MRHCEERSDEAIQRAPTGAPAKMRRNHKSHCTLFGAPAGARLDCFRLRSSSYGGQVASPCPAKPEGRSRVAMTASRPLRLVGNIRPTIGVVARGRLSQCCQAIDSRGAASHSRFRRFPLGIKRERRRRRGAFKRTWFRKIRCKEPRDQAAAAPATVSGESVVNCHWVLGPGKATADSDPRARRPAVSRGHTRAYRSGCIGRCLICLKRAARDFVRGDVPQLSPEVSRDP